MRIDVTENLVFYDAQGVVTTAPTGWDASIAGISHIEGSTTGSTDTTGAILNGRVVTPESED